MSKRLLTVDELSDYLSLPKATIYTWVSLRRIPGVVRLGRALRFDKRDVDEWVNANARGAIPAPGREPAVV